MVYTCLASYDLEKYSLFVYVDNKIGRLYVSARGRYIILYLGFSVL